MTFIKKIIDGNVDDSVHKQFTRFGKGVYGGRAPIGLWKTKKVKLNSGFEYCNDFVEFASDLTDMKFKGIILSKDEIPEMNDIENLGSSASSKLKRKGGKYVYEVNDLSSAQVNEIKDQVYCFLLDGEGEGVMVKMKKKLPKPGKSEKKIDDKFCKMELDEKYLIKAKDYFFWDVQGDVKKIKAKHEYQIEEIVMPSGEEKDFAKVREMAQRKGKIVRKLDVDSKESEKVFEFTA
jgi:hypothetical protein